MQGQQADTRQRLIEGARAAIVERGFADTSTRDVAAAAQTNIASITYHFGGKTALMEAALASCFAEWAQQLDATLAAAPAEAATPAEYLRQVLVATVDSFETSTAQLTACIETHAPAMRSDALRTALADGYATIRQQAVQALTASLGLNSTTPEGHRQLTHAVSVVIALIDGLAIQWMADPTATPKSGDIVDTIRMFGATLTDITVN
ncbi:AcrR family transcriptional regulator [Tsukamurella ocularis]|uniref:TetR/AcrR family transcriptional regulator n=1 Tax=Tsukamurella ocularis TaxID=1970234 RepID=UPI00216A178C|nr:TetR/AcrR family transcriptional regulator [Tsukamurella ocularis]MCS3790021.1 AcrR family transcriptional regulator [Tsukamurella ocularis]